MKVAIQGELGSFSHQAARRVLPRAQVVPCTTSAGVFDRLISRRVQFALLPVENSLAGSVGEHLDLLLAHEVFAQRESLLRIQHHLHAAPGAKMEDIRRVLSHPVALGQCRDFFRRHPHIEQVPFYDTAGAVKHIVETGAADAAAIAGDQAAAQFGSRILRRNLQDDARNFTRFFLLARRRRVLPRANKTSVAFSVKNVAGALFKALSVFALREISLSRIESRPVRGRPWQYVFFVDFLRGDDPTARDALRHLADISDFVKVLGIYPAART